MRRSLVPAAYIAGNTGPTTLPEIEGNFRSMVEIAQANRIRVILANTLPANTFAWRPGIVPTETVRGLNTWLRQYAAARPVHARATEGCSLCGSSWGLLCSE